MEVNFLPVGHTHEDVDQFFSRLSVYLKTEPAQTADDLEEAWLKCYTPTPRVLYLKEVADFKSWAENFAPLRSHGISSARAFKFGLHDDNVVLR